MRRHAPDGEPTVARSMSASQPVFLLGFQRSGTTLLRLLLDAHSSLAIPFESFVLIDFWRRRSTYGDLCTLEQRARLVEDLIRAKGISSWNPRVSRIDIDLESCTSYAATIDALFTAYARHCGKTRWGDKTPSYTSDFHILNLLFPEARFVHLIRDGRDAALSLVRQPWGPSDFPSALRKWNEVVGWARKMGAMLPSARYLEIRYEDLIADPESVLRSVTSFVGLEYEPQMLQAHARVHETMPSRSMGVHRHLAHPVDPQLAEQWRDGLSRSEQALAVKLAGPLLEELGYPIPAGRTSRLLVTATEFRLWAESAIRWRIRRRLRSVKRRRKKIQEALSAPTVEHL